MVAPAYAGVGCLIIFLTHRQLGLGFGSKVVSVPGTKDWIGLSSVKGMCSQKPRGEQSREMLQMH